MARKAGTMQMPAPRQTALYASRSRAVLCVAQKSSGKAAVSVAVRVHSALSFCRRAGRKHVLCAARRIIAVLGVDDDNLGAWMPAGVCKWFDVTKGYGFIKPDDGTQDLFVHQVTSQR